MTRLSTARQIPNDPGPARTQRVKNTKTNESADPPTAAEKRRRRRQGGGRTFHVIIQDGLLSRLGAVARVIAVWYLVACK